MGNKRSLGKSQRNNGSVEKSDNGVKIAFISGIVTIVVTIISALVAPIVLERRNETPMPTSEMISTNTSLPTQETPNQLEIENIMPENIIYSNDFSNGDGGFPIGTTVDGSKEMMQSIINDEYHWEYTGFADVLTKLVPDDLQTLSDFEVSVDVEIIGTEEPSSIGLIVRHSSDQYYYFGIRPKQQVYLMAENEYTDGKWVWSNFPGNEGISSSILSEGFNNLKVVANNDRLTFYVNGNLIADIVDDRIKNGNIGLLVYSRKNIPTTFVVDNFQVKLLP